MPSCPGLLGRVGGVFCPFKFFFPFFLYIFFENPVSQ